LVEKLHNQSVHNKKLGLPKNKVEEEKSDFRQYYFKTAKLYQNNFKSSDLLKALISLSHLLFKIEKNDIIMNMSLE
jgi:hypothetical protein